MKSPLSLRDISPEGAIITYIIEVPSRQPGSSLKQPTGLFIYARPSPWGEHKGGVKTPMGGNTKGVLKSLGGNTKGVANANIDAY